MATTIVNPKTEKSLQDSIVDLYLGLKRRLGKDVLLSLLANLAPRLR